MKSTFIFLTFLLGVLALWLACFFTSTYLFHDLTSAGQFGDSFGVVTGANDPRILQIALKLLF